MLADTLKYSAFTVVGVLVVASSMGRVTPTAPVTVPTPQNYAPTSPAPQAIALPVGQSASALDEYSIRADSRGHFYDNAMMNGQQVRVLVDTGASTVALSYEDASSLLIFPLESEFTITVNTANGAARAAPVRLREVQLGSIKLYDVDALVAERGVMQGSLLGMTFLSRLSHVEMGSGSLTLRR
jgi:aspartyl protease family protein